MTLDPKIQRLIDRLYPAETPGGRIYRSHCSQVAALALEIVRARGLSLDEETVYAAAMLHDIGISQCDAPDIGCHGTQPYICHGMLGADLLRREGLEERLARVAERHTGTGLTAAEIAAEGLPLAADRSYVPESELERLVCYADKFYSKSGTGARKSLDKVRSQMARFGEAAAARFDALHREFGLPGL